MLIYSINLKIIRGKMPRKTESFRLSTIMVRPAFKLYNNRVLEKSHSYVTLTIGISPLIQKSGNCPSCGSKEASLYHNIQALRFCYRPESKALLSHLTFVFHKMLETIFLTGSSGLIGNKCLLRALHNGCKVIASVRSEEKADAVRRTVKSEADSRNLELVIIPDMTISGVFDRIVASVDYVVHVASPLWTVTDFSDMNKALVEVRPRSHSDEL